MDNCEWSGHKRHRRKIKGRQVIRCGCCIPFGVQRVNGEGIMLRARVIVVLNQGELGSSEAAEVVYSSECALPKHVLGD